MVELGAKPARFNTLEMGALILRLLQVAVGGDTIEALQLLCALGDLLASNHDINRHCATISGKACEQSRSDDNEFGVWRQIELMQATGGRWRCLRLAPDQFGTLNDITRMNQVKKKRREPFQP
jgi:hypothetical protein